MGTLKKYFTQTGNGAKRPFRVCRREGIGDWVVISTHATLQEAEAKAKRLNLEHEEY